VAKGFWQWYTTNFTLILHPSSHILNSTQCFKNCRPLTQGSLFYETLLSRSLRCISLADGNRFNIWNAVVYSEYNTVGEVQKSSSPDYFIWSKCAGNEYSNKFWVGITLHTIWLIIFTDLEMLTRLYIIWTIRYFDGAYNCIATCILTLRVQVASYGFCWFIVSVTDFIVVVFFNCIVSFF
jgi:hypothetical protein